MKPFFGILTDFEGIFLSLSSVTKKGHKNNVIFVINGVHIGFIMKSFLSNSVDLMKNLHMRASSKGLALTWKAEVEAEEPADMAIDGGKKG